MNMIKELQNLPEESSLLYTHDIKIYEVKTYGTNSQRMSLKQHG